MQMLPINLSMYRLCVLVLFVPPISIYWIIYVNVLEEFITYTVNFLNIFFFHSSNKNLDPVSRRQLQRYNMIYSSDDDDNDDVEMKLQVDDGKTFCEQERERDRARKREHELEHELDRKRKRRF